MRLLRSRQNSTESVAAIPIPILAGTWLGLSTLLTIGICRWFKVQKDADEEMARNEARAKDLERKNGTSIID